MHLKLPHISLNEYYQFITFRTKDSVDAYIAKLQNDTTLTTRIKQYKIDEYLDNSNNGAYLYDKNINILKEVIFSKDKYLYELEAFSIMPNHVHILLKQKEELSIIIKFIKAKSAIELNKSLDKSGKFWHDSYFDKLIRNQKHYDLVYNYILNNPIKAGIDSVERIYSKY